MEKAKSQFTSSSSPPKPATSSPGGRDADFARQVLRAEAAAIEGVVIGPSFAAAVELILASSGSVVVSGLGKNGPIGQKLSATFASTGTPSHFLHPTEARHGALGRIRRDDVVLVLSYSGNTEEVVALVTILRQDRVPVIALTGGTACD